ncbi:MAG: helix-turn-helix transcriptional regulator [Prevotellaceae bacterium]|jgi:transcriptional regulator with XRE-family HTH domain|nr:helix-turn-helix transcriptional regulator [Prevotellaceae bacterium]
MSVKERLKIFIKSENMRISEFEKSIVVGNGYVNSISKGIGNDKLNIISEKYPNLNIEWLLTGEGEMLKNLSLEQENWINSDVRYESKKHSYESLQRVGLRIDEVCEFYRIEQEELAQIIGIDYNMLTNIIAGNTPATDELLQKILDKYPTLNPVWLISGKGNIEKKQGKNAMEYDKLFDFLKQELADKEKRIEELCEMNGTLKAKFEAAERFPSSYDFNTNPPALPPVAEQMPNVHGEKN